MLKLAKKLGWPWGALLAAFGSAGYGGYEGGYLAMTEVTASAVADITSAAADITESVASDITGPIQRFSDKLISEEHYKGGTTVWMTVSESSATAREHRRMQQAVKDFCAYLDGMNNQTLAAKLKAELGLCG